MGKQSFWSKVREFIGVIGWKVFLWSIRRTQDQYLDEIAEETRDKLRKVLEWCNAYPEDMFIPPTKAEWKHYHWVLENNGLNGTAFTGDISRHIVTGLKRIIEDGQANRDKYQDLQQLGGIDEAKVVQD